MEQSSSFVQLQPFQLSLRRKEFQFDKLLHNGEEDTKSKRRRKGCVQIKANGDEPDFHCLDKFLIREPSDCGEKPGTLIATVKLESRMRRNSKLDAASSSQGRLKDAYFCGLMAEVGGKPAATDESRESWEFSESESWSNHEKEVMEKPVASRNPGNSKNSKAGSRNWPHNFQCLQQQYLTWRKSIPSYDKFMA